ncbi:MAG: ABC transporter permease [Acidimicrobiales bacterium]|nr:MAG: ABC transporter permease [Acidimicrobiales bacterium]
MSGFGTLAKVLALSFIRDKTAVFFTILFPLMFLVLFGVLFTDHGTSKAHVVQVGEVTVLDQLPQTAKTDLKGSLSVTKESGPLQPQLRKVRDGDYDAVVSEKDNQLAVYYSEADQVRSATVRGVLESVVQSANIAASGNVPRYGLNTHRVEDKSIQPIQYQTPGLLGWAISMSAVFGASLTLVEWRRRKVLRRLQLAPVSLAAVITARVGVSIAIALVQGVIFVGIALLPAFGLQLTGDWWLAIPLIICATLAFFAIGLLAGSFAKSAEGASGISNLIVLPMAFLSGAFFPLDSAPAWLRSLSEVFPLKHLVDSMRNVFVRSADLATILPDAALLLAFAAVAGAIAVKLFRWDDV